MVVSHVKQLSEDAGDHIYVVAPLAIIPILSPGHIAADIPVMVTLTVGVGFTLIVTFTESLHDPLVPIILYVVVSAGLALILTQLVQERPVEGLQVNVVAPVAFNTT